MVYVARGCSVVGVVAVIALGSACGLDLSSAGDTDGDSDDSGTTYESDTTGVESTDTWETGPSGGGDTDTGDSDPGAGTGEDDASLCEGILCNGAGHCEVESDGPTCVCEQGFASVGLDCIPCEKVADGSLPATVPSVLATFEFTLDGEPTSTSSYEDARVSLRNRSSGDVVELGSTRQQSTSLLVVPGIYDILYRHTEGNEMPKNSAAALGQLEVRDADEKLQIDIPLAQIRGSIGFENGAPVSPAYDYGELWLFNPRSGDRIELGDTRDQVFDVKVVPGEYQVRYSRTESQGDAPYNEDGIVQTITVTPEVDNQADIVIRTVEMQGTLRIDGAEVPSSYDHGTLDLRDTATGDVVRLGDTRDGMYRLTVLPGEYELVYTSIESSDLAPANRGTILETLWIGEEDELELPLNLQTVSLAGDFTVDGAAPPTEAYDDGVVELRSNGGTVLLGNTHDGSFSQRVLAGTYQAFYAQDTAGVSMPVNTHAFIEEFTLKSDTSRDVNLSVVEVVGTLTIDGADAPDAPYDDGRLFLRNRETGDSALLGSTREGTYAARVVPGTYDVVYENEFSDELLPVNRGAVLQTAVVIAAGREELNIDVPVSTLQGSVEIEGSTPEPSEGIGQLYLRDVASDDSVFIGHTGATDFSKPLTDGTYIMEYRGVAAEGSELGVSLPANAAAAFACYEIASE
jgi:hypothetical protein